MDLAGGLRIHLHLQWGGYLTPSTAVTVYACTVASCTSTFLTGFTVV
jgi:hypothetical protein